MAEALLETRTPEQLERAVAVEPGHLVLVQAPGSPVKAIEAERLFSRFLGVALAASSLAALSADLAHAENTLALVYADPSPDASGYYRKVGAPGAGAWELTRVFRGEKGATGAPAEIVVSRAALKAIVGMADGDGYRLTTPGSQGVFLWQLGNFTARVAADPYEGVFIAANGIDPAIGCWVRDQASGVFEATFWGVDDNAEARARLLSALRLVNAFFPGGAVRLPPKKLNAFGAGIPAGESALPILSNVRLTGYGRDISQISAGHSSSSHTINVIGSNIEIDNIGLLDFYTPDNADARFMINIGTRFNQTGAGAETRNIRIHDILIKDASTGVRAIYNGWKVDGADKWFTPAGIEVWNIRCENIGYQAFVPWCDDIKIRDFYVSMDPEEPSRPFQCAFRIIGCRNVRIHDGEIVDRKGLSSFRIMTGGVDGHPGMDVPGLYRDPEDVYVSNVKCRGLGALFNVLEANGPIEFENCGYVRDLTSTQEAAPFGIGQSSMPMLRGKVRVIGGTFEGFTYFCPVTATNLKEFTVENAKFLGNARTDPASVTGFFNVNVAGNDLAGNAIRGIELCLVKNCEFLFRDNSHSFGFYLAGAPAGTVYRFEGNRLPFGVTNALASTGAADASHSGTTYYPAGAHARALADYAAPRATLAP